MSTHHIGYAYPSSTVARSLGAAKDGSWYLLVGKVAKRHPSYCLLYTSDAADE